MTRGPRATTKASEEPPGLAGEASSPQKMIAGNLKTMDLAELLQWLSQSQKTGTLVINNGKIEKKLYLSEGRIVSSSSSDPKEHLGHFLVSQGLITEEQLADAVRKQTATKNLLGKILVSSEAVTEDDLHRLLVLKAEESIFDIFTWLDGEFRFLHDELPERTFIPLSLDLTGILMEGARRVDEWQRIRTVIPDLASIPVSITDLTDPDQSAGAQKILALVDDESSVEEIQEETHSTAFFVCSVLFEQVKAKKLKIVKPRIVKIEVPVPAPASNPPRYQQAYPPPQQGQPQQQPNYGTPNPQQGYAPPPYGYGAPAGGPPGESGYNPAGQNPAGQNIGSQHSGGPPPLEGDPDQLDPLAMLSAGEGLIAQNDFERAMRYLRAARNTRPEDRSLESAIKNAEHKIRGAIERSGLSMNCIPKLAVSMDQLTSLDVSAQEGFILTRIDGNYDLKSILKISPMPEIDALILFSKLFRAGHVKI